MESKRAGVSHVGSATAQKIRRLSVVLMVITTVPAVGVMAPTPEAAKDLVGPVETVEVEEVLLFDDSETGDAAEEEEQSRRDILRFEDGNLVEQFRYQDDDQLSWHATREYDDEGRLVDWKAIGADEELNWRYEYAYDSEGRVVREVAYGEGGQLEEVLLREYQDNELVEDVMYGPDNTIQWRKSYDEDEEERTKQWSVYYSDGTRIKQIRQKYDGRGRVVEEIHTDQLGATYERLEYSYGPHDQPLEIREFDGSGDLQRRTEFELDEQGNVEEEQVSVPDNDTSERVSREFVYDDFGNWVRKRVVTELVADDDREVVEEKVVRRSIEYETDE